MAFRWLVTGFILPGACNGGGSGKDDSGAGDADDSGGGGTHSSTLASPRHTRGEPLRHLDSNQDQQFQRLVGCQLPHGGLLRSGGILPCSLRASRTGMMGT